MISSMVRQRKGFHTIGAEIPVALWEKLCAEADMAGESATKTLTRILAKHYKVDTATLPKPKRAGRPRKDRP